MANRVLVAGEAVGEVLVMHEPLSFWGGLDAATGEVIDRRHPQSGLVVTGKVLLMPAGRGSSSGSSVFAESIRLGTAPVAVVMLKPDEIVTLGAVVAEELYGLTVPVIVVAEDTYLELANQVVVSIDHGGRVTY